VGSTLSAVPFQENVELISLSDEMELTGGRSPQGDVLIKEQFLCREPEERVFYKGRWYGGLYLNVGASEDDKGQFAEFQRQVGYWVSWRDAKGRRGFCRSLSPIVPMTSRSLAWIRYRLPIGFAISALLREAHLVLRLRLPR
jgi:hypothetical protein